jgi:hypothetical protein
VSDADPPINLPLVVSFMGDLEKTANGGKNAYMVIGSRECAREIHRSLVRLGVPTVLPSDK